MPGICECYLLWKKKKDFANVIQDSEVGRLSWVIQVGLNCIWASLVAQMVKNPPAMWETWVWLLGWEDPLEKGMATHSSIFAWRIPWTEEPGGLHSIGWQRVRHDWSDLACTQGPSQLAQLVKNPPASARDRRDKGSTPGLGRSPGEGNDNPLQYSCLENSTDKGTWWAIVHGVSKSRKSGQVSCVSERSWES